MQTIITYNERELKKGGSKKDITEGYNLWIDLTDPTPSEISNLQNSFALDAKAVEAFLNKSKKPQIRILDNHSFTIILDIKYKDLQTILTEGIYLYLGRGWLITIHSSDIDLMTPVSRLFEEKNKKIMDASVNALYYNILSEIVDRYEHLLTAIELTVADFEQRSLYRPSKKMLEYLNTLSRQIIILRRHFWHVRDIMNFLAHIKNEEGDNSNNKGRGRQGEVKYIEITYDNITQLIELVESYRDTINSTRDLYIANVSLQINDTMRILAIFSAILLPLTFITSLYGMNGLDLNNINNLPVGFAIVLFTMAGIAVLLFLFFKKKQWILVKEDFGLSLKNDNHRRTTTTSSSSSC